MEIWGFLTPINYTPYDSLTAWLRMAKFSDQSIKNYDG